MTGGSDRLGALRSLAVRVGGAERTVQGDGADSMVELTPPTNRRGMFELTPTVVRREHLGLGERPLGSLDTVTMIVQPATVPMPALLDTWAADGPDGPTELDPTSFHTLREYVIGDELRHVHWPTSARHPLTAALLALVARYRARTIGPPQARIAAAWLYAVRPVTAWASEAADSLTPTQTIDLAASQNRATEQLAELANLVEAVLYLGYHPTEADAIRA